MQFRGMLKRVLGQCRAMAAALQIPSHAIKGSIDLFFQPVKP
jgi:hypothetical protein